jgi:hypothetical protein
MGVECPGVGFAVIDLKTTGFVAFKLEAADRIVFTGEFPGVSREQLLREAETLGLRPMSSVAAKPRSSLRPTRSAGRHAPHGSTACL